MLRDDDLDAAVAEGILSETQATALNDLAARRARERVVTVAHEERFRFMSGFNDVFFAIGVVLIVAGVVFFSFGRWFGLALGAAIVWALAELLVARLRLVLPGILLTAMFVALVYAATPISELTGWATSAVSTGPFGLWSSAPIAEEALIAIVMRAAVAAIAAALFYLRFRLPFALLPLAASLVVGLVAALLYLIPGAHVVMNLILVAAGLCVFSVAAWFDFSDPQRITRRADCAFWLHLVAAPLIVHSTVSLIAPSVLTMTAGSALATVAIVFVLAVVAVTIDRRALLVSALSYLGIVIFFAITNVGFDGHGDNALVFFATLIMLGAFILVMGIGWQALRRRVVPLMSPSLVLRLPPTPS